MSLAKVPTIRALSWPVTTAIALNLIPVIGVLFWGWSAFALIFLYWLENLVVGLRTLASMFAAAFATGGMNWLGALFFGAFFTFHYGLFCFGHGVFVILLFGQGTVAVGDNPLDLAAAALALFDQQQNLLVGFASIVGWQAVQFVLWLRRGEARRSNVLELMGSPYPRIITLHAAIIFGGFLLMLLNQPVWGLVVLTLAKMAYDVADAAKQMKPVAANEA
jgi:Family of unknown function (DUF6498)